MTDAPIWAGNPRLLRPAGLPSASHNPEGGSTHQSSSTTRTSTKNVFLLTRFLNVSAKGENFSYVEQGVKETALLARAETEMGAGGLPSSSYCVLGTNGVQEARARHCVWERGFAEGEGHAKWQSRRAGPSPDLSDPTDCSRPLPFPACRTVSTASPRLPFCGVQPEAPVRLTDHCRLPLPSFGQRKVSKPPTLTPAGPRARAEPTVSSSTPAVSSHPSFHSFRGQLRRIGPLPLSTDHHQFLPEAVISAFRSWLLITLLCSVNSLDPSPALPHLLSSGPWGLRKKPHARDGSRGLQHEGSPASQAQALDAATFPLTHLKQPSRVDAGT